MKKYRKYFLLIVLLCLFDITSASAYTKKYYVSNSCDSVSTGTIDTGLRTYSAIPIVNVRAGGHYGISLGFSAQIQKQYWVGDQCVFVEYNNGKVGPCGSQYLRTGSGRPDITGFDSHSNEIYLQDDTSDDIIVLKYHEIQSSNNIGEEYNGQTNNSNIDTNWNHPFGVGNFDTGRIYTERTNVNVGGFGLQDLYYMGSDNSLTRLEKESWKNVNPVSLSNQTYVKSVSYGYCPQPDSSSCPQPTNADQRCSYSVTAEFSSITNAVYERNYMSDDYCRRNGLSAGCYVNGNIQSGICNYTCKYDYGTCTYREHYVKVYNTVSARTDGVYLIDEEDENNSSKQVVGNRFQTIFEKFVPLETLSGRYQYYLTGLVGANGIRSCELNIENDIPDDLHWSDTIKFRSVDINNLFPSRQPNSNWVGYYDTDVQKKIVANTNRSNNGPMYVISLTSSAMRKIAKNTTISDYVGWKLTDNYKPDDISTFSSLTSLGANITINSDVIKSRAKELQDNGYNEYLIEKNTNFIEAN